MGKTKGVFAYMGYKIFCPYFAANGFNVPLMSFARACLFVNHPSKSGIL